MCCVLFYWGIRRDHRTTIYTQNPKLNALPQVAEQERLLKVKHLTDRRIGQLSGEIDSMKGAKVP